MKPEEIEYLANLAKLIMVGLGALVTVLWLCAAGLGVSLYMDLKKRLKRIEKLLIAAPSRS